MTAIIVPIKKSSLEEGFHDKRGAKIHLIEIYVQINDSPIKPGKIMQTSTAKRFFDKQCTKIHLYEGFFENKNE